MLYSSTTALSSPFQNYQSSIINQSYPFYDAVSSISTVKTNDKQLIGITSWDGSVRICQLISYSQGIPNIQQLFYGRYQPANQSCFNQNGSHFYFSDIFGSVFIFDLKKKQTDQILPCTNNPLCSLSIDDQQNHIFITLYTHMSYRYKLNGKNHCTSKNNLTGKTKFKKSIQFESFLFGLTDQNKIHCFFIQGLKNVSSQISWSLEAMKNGYPTTSIAISKNLKRIAVGKDEGIIAIGELHKCANDKFQLKHQYCWYTNRHQQSNSVYVYAVNCIQFHPQNQDILAIGLSDGNLLIHDISQRKIIQSISHNEVPITAMKFTETGKYLIYSIGDDFHQGQIFNPKWHTQMKILTL